MGSRPHFFKIILAHTLEEQKLSLPPRFVSEYGDLFSTSVLLKLPNGRKWKVGLTTKNGKAWLQNGWQEFAEYCGLHVGHFVVFKFDGDSFFNVFIFDNSAFEIKYPCNDETTIIIESENNDSVEIQDNFSEKTSDTSSVCRIDDDLSTRIVSYEEQVFASKEENKDDDKFHAEKIPNSKGRKTISPTEKFEALQRACSFKSRNPFFKILIQPSYTKFGMLVPADFARRYFCNQYGDCKFSIASGQTWLVSYRRRKGLKSKIMILSGLAKFLGDNNLKVGDVCVFELKKVQELFFKVSIFPAKKDQELLSSQGKKSLKRKIEACTASASARREEKDRPLFHHSPKGRDLKLTSRNPYFRIVLYPSHVNQLYFLNIPISFVKTYLKDLKIKHLQEAVLQASDGNKWVARLYTSSRNGRLQIRFSCRTFVVDNKLQAADVCVFELIKDVKVLFNVFIFRSSERKNSHHSEELVLFWPTRDPKNALCSSSRAPKVAEKLKLQPRP